MNYESRPRVHAVPDACRQVGCGRSKLYELIGMGELEAVKSGGTTLITDASIARYLAKLSPAEIRTRPRAALRAAQPETAHQ